MNAIEQLDALQEQLDSALGSGKTLGIRQAEIVGPAWEGAPGYIEANLPFNAESEDGPFEAAAKLLAAIDAQQTKCVTLADGRRVWVKTWH